MGNTTGGFGSSNTDSYGSSTTSGPHNSDTANKLDPRVDSDNSKPYGGSSGYGSTRDSDNSRFDSDRTTGGYGSSTTGGYGSGNTTSGPHSSDMANKADPRVDSDNSRFDSDRTTGGYGSSNTGYGSGNTDYNDRTGHDDSKKDSTMGKLMEKAGNMLGKDNIAEKGREKREQAGRSDDY